VLEQLLEHHLAGLSSSTAFAGAGLLMAFGANQPAIPRRAAAYVDKILNGAAPGELPVEEPQVFDLAVNKGVADALGLMIPPSIAARVTTIVDGAPSISEYPRFS
jgi:putative ABC transport system substrate-binding protein